MDNENGSPRDQQAPAEQSGQNDADKAAPIRNQVLRWVYLEWVRPDGTLHLE